MSIAVPSENTNKTLFRAIAEQAVECIPYAGFLTSLYRVTHPSAFERDLELWRNDITGTVNDHERRLAELESRHNPTLALSALALEIGMWLVRTDEDSAPSHRIFQSILLAFPAASSGQVDEAISELEELALVNASRLTGLEGFTVRATWPLYWLISPLFGATPVSDAVGLAGTVLEEEGASLSAFRLAQSLGWNPRRINSAMVMISKLLPSDRASKAANPSYVITGISIDAGSRVKLRRFVSQAIQAGLQIPVLDGATDD